jgi:hypothetical protein
MAKLDNQETEWVTVESADGTTYEVEIEVSTYCIRKGNYSRIAEDPEEYYGIYYDEVAILGGYSEETEEWVEGDELPKDVINEIEAEYEV